MNNSDRNWEAMQRALAAESSGKSPRLFSSRRTLFGIPSALDQELEQLSEAVQKEVENDSGMKQKADPNQSNNHKSACVGGSRKDLVKEAKRTKRVIHPLLPVFNSESKALILGTMPSPKSRETGFYYNHPQNRFWRVMAAIFDESVPMDNVQKEALVLKHHLALWDVLAECEIEGASDGTIANCVPNDIASVLRDAPIDRIFCTGAKAAELYAKYCEPNTGMKCIRLPSTSPANAAFSLERLIEEYQIVAETVK